MWSTVFRHLLTGYLFLASDVKTIVFPVIAFACIAAPVQGIARFIHAFFWVILHLLQFNTSNQRFSVEEDAENKPWRPIPSGRISIESTTLFRRILFFLCILVSPTAQLSLISALYGFVTFLHDDGALSKNWITKNVCNSIGYFLFELGATMILRYDSALDSIAISSLVLSVLVVLTTVQVQDFADIAGDQAVGRKTWPIVSPRSARLFTLASLALWSIYLPLFWKPWAFGYVVVSCLGTYLGIRIALMPSVVAAQKSYVLYNIWIVLVHVLPLKSRLQGSI